MHNKWSFQMKNLLIVFSVIFGCSVFIAYATDCSSNGRAYFLGARVGPSVCMPNGTWQPPVQQPHVQQHPGQQPQPQVQQLQQKTLTPTEARQRIQDLQEMHNHCREQIDAGLKTLAENQGKGGLPAAPDTRTQPGEVPPLEPDANIATMLQQQQHQADQTEQEVQQWR